MTERQISYPSQKEEVDLINYGNNTGFSIGVEFPTFNLGVDNFEYIKYGSFSPMTKLIEESQKFINMVCDRHCIDKPVWTKQSGCNDRYEYEPQIGENSQLRGYPLNDKGFWDGFKSNIENLGSGLNRNQNFDPWENLAGKPQWSGNNYSVRYPYPIVANSSRPHTESMFHYGKINIEDYNQYIPKSTKIRDEIINVGRIVETKTIHIRNYLPRHYEGTRFSNYFYVDLVLFPNGFYGWVDIGDKYPFAPPFQPGCRNFTFQNPYAVCGDLVLFPRETPRPIGTRNGYDKNLNGAAQIDEYFYSGTVDYSPAVNYLFNDDTPLPNESLGGATVINFEPGGGRIIDNMFRLGTSFDYTYPDGPDVNVQCNPNYPAVTPLKSTTCSGVNIPSGAYYSELSLFRTCSLDMYPLMYRTYIPEISGSYVFPSSINTHNMRKRTGIIYDSGNSFFDAKESFILNEDGVGYNNGNCAPDGMIPIFANSENVDYRKINIYTKNLCEKTIARSGAYFSNGDYFLYCQGFPPGDTTCGEVIRDATIDDDKIIIPSGKFVLAFSLEASISGAMETWRDRSYTRFCEIEVDANKYQIQPVSLAVSGVDACHKYPLYEMCPSGEIFTNDKYDNLNFHGYGFASEDNYDKTIMVSGISKPIYNASIDFAEIFSCGFENGHNFLCMYTFREMYDPSSNPKWVSTAAYTDLSEIAATGKFVYTFNEDFFFLRSGTVDWSMKGLGYSTEIDHFMHSNNAPLYPPTRDIVNGSHIGAYGTEYFESGKSVFKGSFMSTIIEPPDFMYDQFYKKNRYGNTNYYDFE